MQGQVQLANSDSGSQDFMNNQPSFMQVVNAHLSEGMQYAAAGSEPAGRHAALYVQQLRAANLFPHGRRRVEQRIGVTIGNAAPLNGQPPAGSNYLVFPNCDSAYRTVLRRNPTAGRNRYP